MLKRCEGKAEVAEPQTKRKRPDHPGRPDVTARTERKKTHKNTVVRVKLKGLLTDDGKRLHWDPTITEVTKAWWHAGVLANQVVAAQLEQGRPVPELDQAFYQHCFQAVDQHFKPSGDFPPVILAAARTHQLACTAGGCNLPDLAFLSGFKNNGAKMMATNAQVSCCPADCLQPFEASG